MPFLLHTPSFRAAPHCYPFLSPALSIPRRSPASFARPRSVQSRIVTRSFPPLFPSLGDPLLYSHALVPCSPALLPVPSPRSFHPSAIPCFIRTPSLRAAPHCYPFLPPALSIPRQSPALFARPRSVQLRIFTRPFPPSAIPCFVRTPSFRTAPHPCPFLPPPIPSFGNPLLCSHALVLYSSALLPAHSLPRQSPALFARPRSVQRRILARFFPCPFPPSAIPCFVRTPSFRTAPHCYPFLPTALSLLRQSPALFARPRSV
ncbi:hypothetical protein C8R45DRAFT_1130928 [Mycena sanguinolenta]|nr:hypothetical protein C8R45DRAFT_1130928 [Mycena sanguinolenta]